MNEQIESLESIDLTSYGFDPAATFDCGQAFRWKPIDREGKEWIGIVNGLLLSVTKTEAKVLAGVDGNAGGVIRTYLSLGDDLNSIRSSFPSDEFLQESMKQYIGLRLLTQDPWECLISFVCSINSNIPSIRLKIENICRRYGKRIKGVSGEFFTFPSPSSLAKADKRGLLDCKTGFRWRYINFIATRVTSGELDLDSLRKMPYGEAHQYLLSEISGNTLGVGPKVADCTLLFSYHKLEAFPIDIWMARCIKSVYLDTLDIPDWKNLTRKRYAEISGTMRKHFGPFAGYAQQYLYAKFRSDALYSRNKAGLKGSA